MYKKISYVLITFFILYLFNFFILERDISLKVGEKAVLTTFNQLNIRSEEGFFDVDSSKAIELIGKKAGEENVTLDIFGIPIKKVAVEVKEKEFLIPVGTTLGIRIHTKGVLVLGSGNITNKEGNTVNPAKDKIFSGDIIYKVNDIEISSKEELMHMIEDTTENEVKLTISRKNETLDINVIVVKSIVDNKNKIGIWVRDSTQGIGTMTYINPNTMEFGALGHGILDIDTKELMSVEEGYAYVSTVTSVTKGEKGIPGEIIGEITINDKIGSVEYNEKYGIFGLVDDFEKLGCISEPLEIASIDEVTIGEAEIFCSVDKNGVNRFNVEILDVNHKHKDNKNFVLKIKDDDLLNATSGIVQGMSGSPIVQNNKIIGAVTHVFVQDPTKGYGIYIENMMKK